MIIIQHDLPIGSQYTVCDVCKISRGFRKGLSWHQFEGYILNRYSVSFDCDFYLGNGVAAFFTSNLANEDVSLP